MTLYWSDTPVIIESHPGPTAGAIWVSLPDEKIVFVGDAVLKGQPPFLAHADIPAWLEALDVLQSADYKGFAVISGRGGIVSPQAIRAQVDVLKKIHSKIETLGKKRSTAPMVTDKLADSTLKEFKAPAAKHQQYSQRLRYGLRNYYLRHYISSSRNVIDE
jgi:glyoxylase-like metal-dependent hydrolase (beta-lactamase superfamily II)